MIKIFFLQKHRLCDRILFIGFFFFLFDLSACKKFAEIGAPNTVITSDAVFHDAGAATSALTNIYNQMNYGGDSYKMTAQCGPQADEFSVESWSNFLQFYQNALTPLNTPVGFWFEGYNCIYQANAVSEGVKKSGGLYISVRNQLQGEALFIRAFWHFYLSNLYGDVPIVTSTDYSVNQSLARSPKEQVYAQMVIDLSTAQNLLNINYVDRTDTATTTARVRPTKAAAAALLARVYLYEDKYDSAEMAASSVIADSRFSLEPDLNQVFLANSNEAIWQLPILDPNYADNQTPEGANFLDGLVNGTGSNRAGLNISSWMLNSFEHNDRRAAKWIDSLTVSGITYYYPYKYQIYANAINPNNRTEYTMVLRLAEQFLIRAEARVNKSSPDIAGALSDLNRIRNRAGLPNYAGPTDKASMLTAILHERQVELFTEWGHRWFDLIRTGNVNSVLGSPGNICQLKGGSWKPEGALYPINQTELNNDNNLTQTPGY